MDQNFLNNLVFKALAFVLASSITITGWFVKVELTEMTTTLKEIKMDVSDINRESLLLKQQVNFQLQWMEKEIKRIRSDYAAWKEDAWHKKTIRKGEE